MGICRFKTSEVKPLIEHALAATEFDMGYENMTDEQFAELGMPPPTNRTPRGPALLFVHDQGVYLMSNGIPRLRPENPAQDVNSCHVAYAEGCNPNVGEFDDWYGTSRALVGGDDFVEVLLISDNWLRACDQCETFELEISDTAISSRFTGTKSHTVAPQPVVAGEPVAELNLSVRARKCVDKLGVKTIQQLTRFTAADLKEIRNFGAVSLKEVREKLAERGLTLKGETLASQRDMVSR